MSDNEIIARFKRFLVDSGSKTVTEVAVYDGVAYVTDGRIGFAARMSDPHDNCVPEGYPIEHLKGILGEALEQTAWSALDLAEFKALDADFIGRVKQAMAEARSDYNSRYTAFDCPCCGETLYWDGDNDEVVREKEAMRVIEARDVYRTTRVEFCDGSSIVVNFCFLHMVHHFLGEGYMRFAVGENKEGKRIMYMRSEDGAVHGALFPLVVEDGEKTDCTVHAVATESEVAG